MVSPWCPRGVPMGLAWYSVVSPWDSRKGSLFPWDSHGILFVVLGNTAAITLKIHGRLGIYCSGSIILSAGQREEWNIGSCWVVRLCVLSPAGLFHSMGAIIHYKRVSCRRLESTSSDPVPPASPLFESNQYASESIVI